MTVIPGDSTVRNRRHSNERSGNSAMARRRQADIEKQQTAILNTLREFPVGLKQTAL
jgi:hypothetical protein